MISKTIKEFVEDYNLLIKKYKPKGFKKVKTFSNKQEAIKRFVSVKMAVAKFETLHLKGESKMGKKKGTKEAKVLEASAIFGIAGKEAEKAGEREYPFLALGETHIFKVKATKGKNPKGEKCIRKGFMLDGKQITAQAAKILLDTVGRANGETPEGRAVARTKPALAAMQAWQEKHNSFLVAQEGDSKGKKEKDDTKVAGFKKKQLKIEIRKKEVKTGLKDLFSKKELKQILKSFGNEKKMPLVNVIKGIDSVSPITTDEIKQAFKSHFE